MSELPEAAPATTPDDAAASRSRPSVIGQILEALDWLGTAVSILGIFL